MLIRNEVLVFRSTASHNDGETTDPVTLGPNVAADPRAGQIATSIIAIPRRNALYPGSPMSPPGSNNAARSTAPTEATTASTSSPAGTSSSASEARTTNSSATSPSGRNV